MELGEHVVVQSGMAGSEPEYDHLIFSGELVVGIVAVVFRMLNVPFFLLFLFYNGFGFFVGDAIILLAKLSPFFSQCISLLVSWYVAV